MFLTDDELFIRIKNSDRKAFDMLYEKYWEVVYKKSFSYLQDCEAAAEIVNDIFLNIWVKRKDLRIITLGNYLTAAARYRVYNALKLKKNRQLTYIESYTNYFEINVDKNSGEENIAKAELYEKMSKLLNQLPKRCSEIFLLSRHEHLTNSEIAARLSISKRTVENQLSIAVKFLKNHLIIFILLKYLATTCL